LVDSWFLDSRAEHLGLDLGEKLPSTFKKAAKPRNVIIQNDVAIAYTPSPLLECLAILFREIFVERVGVVVDRIFLLSHKPSYLFEICNLAC
jgi:hypothetical protein